MTPSPERAAVEAPLAETKARRRSASVVLAATLLATAGVAANLGGWHSDKANAVEAAVSGAETRLAQLNADTARVERALGELERKRAETETAVSDAAKRVAALDDRREALQQQVADLAGPVSADAGEVEATPAPPTPDSTAAIDVSPSRRLARLNRPTADDPSPPDAAEADEPADAAPAPRVSTALVDTPQPRARPVVDVAPAATAATAGAVRVFIHIQSDDPAARGRARALAAELRRQGVEVAQIRGVRLPIRQNMVRYFYDSDREAVSALQSALSEASGGAPARAQDFRGFRAAPRQGTIELWMS